MKTMMVFVKADVPNEVTVPQFLGYVEDAVGNWKGQFPIEEPLFHLDRKSVKVKHLAVGFHNE